MDDFFGCGIGMRRFAVGVFLTSKRNGDDRRKRVLSCFWGLLFVSALFFSVEPTKTSRLGAQEDRSPDRHVLGDQMEVGVRTYGYKATGESADFYQPVRFIFPEKTISQIASPSGFLSNPNDAGLFGLKPGEVYRFKLSEIPYHPGKELYPTLEMLGRLSPPAGHETEFPIPIELTQADIESALTGNLVTRVVFLEPPRNALPVDSTLPAGKLLIEAPASINPVALAESRGRLMAILRVGSRIPDEGPNPTSSFYFGLPSFTLPLTTPKEMTAEPPKSAVSDTVTESDDENPVVVGTLSATVSDAEEALAPTAEKQ